MATFKAEIDHSADDQDVEIDVAECRWHSHLGQDVDGSQGLRVRHQRTMDEVLDAVAPDPRPDPLVFASRFVFRRLLRPVDTEMTEGLKTHGHRAAALIECRVQIEAQAGDGRMF